MSRRLRRATTRFRDRVTREVTGDAGVSTVEIVVIAIALVGLALFLTQFLRTYLDGWLAQLPT